MFWVVGMTGTLLEGSFLREAEGVGRLEPGVVLPAGLAFIGGKAIHSHDGKPVPHLQ